jgi:hypothetical protein
MADRGRAGVCVCVCVCVSVSCNGTVRGVVGAGLVCQLAVMGRCVGWLELDCSTAVSSVATIWQDGTYTASLTKAR